MYQGLYESDLVILFPRTWLQWKYQGIHNDLFILLWFIVASSWKEIYVGDLMPINKVRYTQEIRHNEQLIFLVKYPVWYNSPDIIRPIIPFVKKIFLKKKAKSSVWTQISTPGSKNLRYKSSSPIFSNVYISPQYVGWFSYTLPCQVSFTINLNSVPVLPNIKLSKLALSMPNSSYWGGWGRRIEFKASLGNSVKCFKSKLKTNNKT